MAAVLICHGDRRVGDKLGSALVNAGHAADRVCSTSEALAKLNASSYDMIVGDLRTPPAGVLALVHHAQQTFPEVPFLVLTAPDDYESAVAAVCAGGATAYIRESPGLVDEVTFAVQCALEKARLRRENLVLRRDAASRNSLDQLVGRSRVLENLKQLIRAVAPTPSTVLITGESGTGKELVARAIHSCSPRAPAPFVSFNCGAFPEALLESELFGHVKGAFTGAAQSRRGLLEVAQGGTVFLDEIGDMTPAMQVKLLRVLQERRVRPLGCTREYPIDVRVLAATHRDLHHEVAAGNFREDLYYRLNVVPIAVPPLREHSEDVPLLAAHFSEHYAHAAGKTLRGIAAACLPALCAYPWPGNVRQLENAVECAVALQNTPELWIEAVQKPKALAAVASAEPRDVLASGVDGVVPDGLDLPSYLAQVERSLIQAALARSHGVQIRASGLLKISYRSFRHLMKKYSL